MPDLVWELGGGLPGGGGTCAEMQPPLAPQTSSCISQYPRGPEEENGNNTPLTFSYSLTECTLLYMEWFSKGN